MAAMACAATIVLASASGAHAAAKKADSEKPASKKAAAVSTKKPTTKSGAKSDANGKKATAASKASSGSIAKATVRKPVVTEKPISRPKVSPAKVEKAEPAKAHIGKAAVSKGGSKVTATKVAPAPALSEDELFNRPAAAPGAGPKAPAEGTLPGAHALDQPAVAPAPSHAPAETDPPSHASVNRGPQPYPGEISVEFHRPAPAEPLSMPEPEAIVDRLGDAAAAAETTATTAVVSAIVPDNSDGEAVTAMPEETFDPQPFGDASAVVGSRRGIPKVSEAFLPDEPPASQATPPRTIALQAEAEGRKGVRVPAKGSVTVNRASAAQTAIEPPLPMSDDVEEVPSVVAATASAAVRSGGASVAEPLPGAAVPTLARLPEPTPSDRLAPPTLPKKPAKEPDLGGGMGDLFINANNQTDFDVNQRRIVFTGNVVMKNDRFYLTSDKLVAYMLKDNAGLEFAEAQGNVVVRLLDEGQAQGSVGYAKTAVYRPKSNEITLRGWPKIQQGPKVHMASSATTEMVLGVDGRMKTSGRNETVFVSPPQ